MAVAKTAWTDFAILQASQGGKEWKVQINPEGQFRCNCPSFIYSRVSPRTCKHCKRCGEELLSGKTVPATGAAAIAMANASGVAAQAAAKQAALKDARAICEAMQAQVAKVHRYHMAPTIWETMSHVLADKLMAFKPHVPVGVVAEAVIGVRRITFDD